MVRERLEQIRKRAVSVLTAGLVCFAAGVASADPLDLADRTPRWIEVRFEVSPADEPGALDRRWSGFRPARLLPAQAGADPGAVEIRIPAREIEAQLRSTGTDTIEGSFSEFVWRLDPSTGHVLEAGLRGRVREQLQFGPISAAAMVEIQIQMTTAASVGFEPSRGILGVRTNHLCAPNGGNEACTEVMPIRYDPSRGYVNAVGSVRAATAMAEIEAFSPLGEVQFRERPRESRESVISGSSRGEALCSQVLDRPCSADLGGES